MLDTATGDVRRIADQPLTYATWNDQIVVVDGRSVTARPAGGGAAVHWYTIEPSPLLADSVGRSLDLHREGVLRIEFAPDRRAVVSQAVPSPDNNTHRLVDRVIGPDGGVLADALEPPSDNEWSPDGTRLLRASSIAEATIHDMDGTLIESLSFASSYTRLQWTSDGRSVIDALGPGITIHDLAAGTSRVIEGVDGGFDVHESMVAGARPYSASGEFDPPGIAIVDLRSGKARTVTDFGEHAVWSAQGSRLLVSGRPMWRPGMPETWVEWYFEILDPGSGAVAHTVKPAAGLSIPPPGDTAISFVGPQWAGDRHVVFAVADAAVTSHHLP